MDEKRILERLRRVCLSLPEAQETVTFGHPTFQAGKRTFAVLEEYKGRLCLCFKATPAEQRRLCVDPRYFVAPYTGKHGWTSLILDGGIDWAEVGELLYRSYRHVALQRMLRALAARPPAWIGRTLLALLLVGSSLACGALRPQLGTECLAPANAGGWDLTCRSFSRVLAEVRPDKPVMRVTNLPGAGGGIAFAHVVSRREADPNLIVAASPATTLRLAQGQFGDFTESDVEWLAAIAADFGVIAVAAQSPWPDLASLLEDWRRRPEKIVVAGGSAVGGQDHMKVLILARAAGLDVTRIRYVPFDGGGEAMTALLGGFVQVVPADASEVLGQLGAGNIRVLAVLARERLPAPLDPIPTAHELGYPVEWVIWRGFYAPSRLSEEARTEWLDVMEAVATSEKWAELRGRLGLAPFFLGGAAFETFVREQVATFRDLTRSLGLAP